MPGLPTPSLISCGFSKEGFGAKLRVLLNYCCICRTSSGVAASKTASSFSLIGAKEQWFFCKHEDAGSGPKLAQRMQGLVSYRKDGNR
jgi:hypothetical protein